MNSELMRWLLDIETIPPDAADLHLAWERPWPAWAWALLFMAAGLFAIWSYSRLAGHRAGRGVLAAARFGILLLALVLVSGPMLELPRETIEEDWVLMLADRSASMSIADVQREGPGTSRRTRDEQLASAIDRAAPVLSLLASQREVVWMGFHSGAFNLEKSDGAGRTDEAASTSSIPALGPADGRRTSIDAALEQALQRAAARPVSGIVLLSDGRADNPPSRSLVRRLQADAIPVFVVPLGAEDPLGDLAVADVEAPRRAFVHDKVPVVVDLDRFGNAAQSLTGVVRLIDEATGEELDSADIAEADDASRITLTAEPSLAGESTWKVVVDTPEQDLVPDNNSRTFGIDLVDRPLRVLYIEGYPRWEYRYVKELIRREKTIESSVMLISASSDFAQEGNVPITRLPRSPEEFAAYDVLIIGDVPAGFFSPEQLEMMRNHVAERGAGLLWIAGERAVPSSYVGAVLSDLLPMRGSLNLSAMPAPVTLFPTTQAARLGVMQLAAGADVGWPQELSDPATGWSRLFYAQRIEPGQLKPAVEVLAQTVGSSTPLGSSDRSTMDGGPGVFPIVMSMRYGSGQSIYVATDEIWRWRYGRGELFPDQFWMQMIRLLGRESLSTSGNQAVLEVSPRRAMAGSPVRIELRLLDSQLIQQSQVTVRVAIRNAAGETVGEVDLRRVEGSEDLFAATYLADAPGRFDLTIDDPAFATLDLSGYFEVFSPDDELRRPETDHELLRSLANATGGRVIDPQDLGELPQMLPNREVRTLNPLTEPIWDSPAMLLLALLLLTFEWVGRKMIRLV